MFHLNLIENVNNTTTQVTSQKQSQLKIGSSNEDKILNLLLNLKL